MSLMLAHTEVKEEGRGLEEIEEDEGMKKKEEGRKITEKRNKEYKKTRSTIKVDYREKQVKLTRNTLAIIAPFILCYLPWWILAIATLCTHLAQHNTGGFTCHVEILALTHDTFCNFVIIAYMAIQLNTCLNPLVYFFSARYAGKKGKT